jgi:hypothetical protein
MSPACEASVSLLKHNLLAGSEPRSDVLGTADPLIIKETKMKIALIGAAAVAAAAFATPVLAQAVIENPGRCAQFNPDANCQNVGAGNPYIDGGYWRNGNATQSAGSEPYRYYGGPKSND